MVNFATLLTEDHVPGALALGQSLSENSGFGTDIHFHVLIPEGLSAESRSKISNLPVTVTFYDEDWNIEYKCSNDLIPDHKRINQYKFNTFRLPVDKVTFLDSDMLCLGNVEPVRDMSEFSVVMGLGKNGYSTINNRPKFNSGMFICEPSRERFEELQAFGANWDKQISRGDQPIMNEFYLEHYPERVNYLSPSWNVIQPWRFKSRRFWKSACEDGIKFLHYTHVKPWENYWPQKKDELYYIWDKLHKKYILYRKLQLLWKPYYRRSMEHS